ncbi:MAG: Mur ligase domain-containing protein [Burkholderiales bacterium]|nr:Mur ligase domain-containing protein [Burkholderiales bacterium]
MSSVANGAGVDPRRLAAEAAGVLAALREQGVAVTGISADSRLLGDGDLFVAYRGERADGRAYIGQAIAEGAAAVVWEREGFAWDPAPTARPPPASGSRRASRHARRRPR